MEQKMIFVDIKNLDSYDSKRNALYADPAIRRNGFLKTVKTEELVKEGELLNSFVMEGIAIKKTMIAIILDGNEKYALSQDIPVEPCFARRFVLFNAEPCGPDEADFAVVVENGKYVYKEYVRFAYGRVW